MERSALEDLFARLNEAGVRYLVAGGLAVVAHGHVRLTMDVDLILDLRQEPVASALEILKGLDYKPHVPVSLDDFADPETRGLWFRERHMRVLSLWSPRYSLTEIDLFVVSPLADFDEAFSHRMEKELTAGVTISFVGYDDLLLMKRAAGRPEDLADVRALEAIHGEGGP